MITCHDNLPWLKRELAVGRVLEERGKFIEPIITFWPRVRCLPEVAKNNPPLPAYHRMRWTFPLLLLSLEGSCRQIHLILPLLIWHFLHSYIAQSHSRCSPLSESLLLPSLIENVSFSEMATPECNAFRFFPLSSQLLSAYPGLLQFWILLHRQFVHRSDMSTTL